MKTEKVDRRVRKTKARLTEGPADAYEGKRGQGYFRKGAFRSLRISTGAPFTCITGDVYDMLDSVEDELFCQFSEILNRDFHRHTGGTVSTASWKTYFHSFMKICRPARCAHGRHGDLAFHQPYEGSGQGTYSPGMEPEQPTLTGL